MPPNFQVTESPHDILFVHNRKEYLRNYNGRRRTTRMNGEQNKRIIAWDGEGIKLQKDGPQSYVLFGCSAEPHNPLKISSKHDDLDFVRLADYMCDVSDRYPEARHVGYFFGYDQNMIIKSLPWGVKERIYKHGWVKYSTDIATYRINVRFGKQIHITRERSGVKSSIRIDDIGPFFACSFVKAYQGMFPDYATDAKWQTVVNGKLNRATTKWVDRFTVEDYWIVEIEALERLAVFFRDLMFRAGFPLTQWYGPGALAQKIRQIHTLRDHEWGGKEENLPAEVHKAAKYAFFGGHFEQYVFGRINRPVYGLDIRSAYPFAFTQVPTLREGGFWQRVDFPAQEASVMGVYHIRYSAPDAASPNGFPRRGFREPQPLPWRNERGEVVYSTVVEGWYWAPEVRAVLDLFPDRVEIIDGWEWRPADDSRPWAEVLLPMFARRRELKEAGDPCQMAFKLGPNSLYGKMAQRTGWNQVTNTPPRSHTLCIAGFITSYCRALIMRVIAQIPMGQLIAVETDGIYTTQPPDSMELPNGVGPELGQWEVERYDEMLYIQNGLYLAREGERWSKIKTRGIRAEQITAPAMLDYLRTLGPDGKWASLTLSAGERFTGLGAALGRSRNSRGQIIPPKAARLHCRWTKDERDVIPGGRGKRSHARAYCRACKAGLNAYEGEHELAIATPHGFDNALDHSRTFNPMSAAYQLPWEVDYVAPEWVGRDIVASHLLTAEDLRDMAVTLDG